MCQPDVGGTAGATLVPGFPMKRIGTVLASGLAMRAFGFRAWREALLGSLGLLSACGGQATTNEGSDSGDPTASDGSGGTGSDGTGRTTNNGTTFGSTTFGVTAGASVTTGASTTTGGAPELLHRAEPVPCEPFHPSAESAIPPEYRGEAGASNEGANFNFQCEFDSECTVGTYGDCQFYYRAFDQVYAGTRCSYGCQVDADCDVGFVCECSGGNNRCVPATCTTDADCGANKLCLRSEYFNGCDYITHYGCQSERDECARGEDCPIDKGCGFDGHHKCIEPNCVVGRPFLIHGVERRAGTERRSDWQVAVDVDISQLTPRERRALATRWQAIGSMEHASIAAFARFALQLLSIGAPPDLLARTQAALADETRHAQLAYGIGARYAGRDLGPGPLDIDGALGERDLLSLVVNTVLEGCIGETVAAAEAAWGRDRADDPVLRDVLAGIAADEARHAELAFAFVHWAVRREPSLAAAVLDTAIRELATLPPDEPDSADGWLARHGLLPDSRRSALRRQALQEMVLPCLRGICTVERAA